MKKFSLLFSLFLLLIVTFGQIPPNYYSSAQGKKQEELREALFNIISSGYVQRTYSQLWTDFKTTDVRSDGKVWDMYSECDFTFGTHQDSGSGGKEECEFYNREHSVPNSWFGGEKYPMYTDLFHLYPTDKYVNNQRGNYPYGEANSSATIYGNGSKKGNGTPESGYTGIVFEPIDEYKGDFARTYFYMATRYLNTNFSHDSEGYGVVSFLYSNSTCELTDYAVNLFLKWHRNDPVSDKEIARNNAVYTIQNNRNPYIDYADMVEHIWGNRQNEAWYSSVGISENEIKPSITITKHHAGIFVEGAPKNSKIEIFSSMGQRVYFSVLTSNFVPLNHISKGVYIIIIDRFAKIIVW